MKAEIISVGTELLLGDIVNTNAQYLSRELASLGFTVQLQSTVGDNEERLAGLVAAAKERSDLLLFTGGLGPTADDLTKETVARVFGDELILDGAELDKIRSHFAGTKEMPRNNVKQAMVPKHGDKIPNSCGTAPGVIFRDDGKTAILLPGPPQEMKTMFELSVRDCLAKSTGVTIVSRMLHVFGPGESELELLVSDLLEGANPTAALYAKNCEVEIRLTARAGSREQAGEMIGELAEKFRERLGACIYSETVEGLEYTVVSLLTEKHRTVAAAESCTGGLFCKRLTDVPGASACLGTGAVTYSCAAKRRLLGVRPSTLKKFTAVSAVTAAEMASGIRKAGKAYYGIGITGYAGPDGGTAGKPVGTVYIALAEKDRIRVKKIFAPDSTRDRVRRLSTQHALDMVRRAALGLDITDSVCFDRHNPTEY